jgi:hypothetical protein
VSLPSLWQPCKVCNHLLHLVKSPLISRVESLDLRMRYGCKALSLSGIPMFLSYPLIGSLIFVEPLCRLQPMTLASGASFIDIKMDVCARFCLPGLPVRVTTSSIQGGWEKERDENVRGHSPSPCWGRPASPTTCIGSPLTPLQLLVVRTTCAIWHVWSMIKTCHV